MGWWDLTNVLTLIGVFTLLCAGGGVFLYLCGRRSLRRREREKVEKENCEAQLEVAKESCEAQLEFLRARIHRLESDLANLP